MIKLTLASIMVSLSMLLQSCVTQANYGFPNCVEFDKEGGTKKVYGDHGLGSLEITNYDGDSGSSQWVGYNIATFDWLTVKATNNGHYMIITAKPNDTGRKRKLYISSYYADEYAEIVVVQNK